MIKGAAILMLLFYHLYYYVTMFDAQSVNFAPFGVDAVMRFSRIFNVCVNIFLFITVFGMYRSMQEKEAAQNHGTVLPKDEATGQRRCSLPEVLFRYSLSRFIGLESAFLAVYLTCVLCFGRMIETMEYYGTGFRAVFYAFLDMTALSSFLGTPSINGSWWYLEIVIVVIFLMPLLYLASEKFGPAFYALLLLWPHLAETDYTVRRFGLIVMLALASAKYNLPERFAACTFRNRPRLSMAIKWLISMVLIAGFTFLRQSESDVLTEDVHLFAENMLAFMLILSMYLVWCRLPGIRIVYGFLGKHSTNIYFAHLFFSFSIPWTRSFLFSFRWFGLIYLAFFALSLLYSVALNAFKKLVRYDALTRYLQSLVL